MKRATYEDVLSAPENKVAEILDGIAVCSGSDTVRVEPFDAIELALGRLWVESPTSPDSLREALE